MSAVKEKVRWAAALWRGEEALLARIVVLSVLKAVIVSCLPFLFKAIIDRLAHVGDARSLGALTILMGATGVAGFVVTAALQTARAKANLGMERRLRGRIFSRLLDREALASSTSLGDIVTRLTDDLGPGKLTWFMTSGIFRAFEGLLVLAGAVVSMLSLNAPLAGICLAPLPLILLVYARAARTLGARHRALQGAVSSQNAELESTFSGIRVVRAGGLEKFRVSRFDAALAGRKEAEIKAVTAHAVLESLYGYAWQICVVLVLFAGGSWIIEGKITLGDFVAFNSFTLYLTYPIFDLGNLISRWRQALVNIERLQELEAPQCEDGAPPESAGPAPHPEDGAGLAVRGVSYGYPRGGAEVVRSCSFTLRRGEMTALAGPVGSGKSTVLKVLAGLLRPREGSVALEGTPLAAMEEAERRRRLGYVPQDPVTFSMSVRDNIRLGRDGLSEEAVIDAARRSCMEDEIRAMPDGWDTLTGQRGLQLSGGQKQRLALARAWAAQPDVLLLDSPTSSLDGETERCVMDALRAAATGRFCLVATHSRALLESSDRILVLDDGRLVEDGTHDELMAARGPYFTLYRRQYLKDADLAETPRL